MTEEREQQYTMIGLKIAYYRKLRGYTQIDFAEVIGVSRTHLSNIEAPNVHISFSLDKLLDIADALDIPASALLDFDK